uniref:NADH-ubiquinone oxidoreductase chain 4 n=1 Tax=Gondogeneia antarctica TaxID=1109128 RepID=G8IQQ1_GONAN|nr:NADH dehydrogenase subunit 4 [Gondogeneia antarctica]
MLGLLYMSSAVLMFSVNWGEIIFCLSLSLSFLMLSWGESSLNVVSHLFEVDLVGLGLIHLSVWLSVMCLLASMKIKKEMNNASVFSLLNILLLVFLLLSFSVSDNLLFFISFECCLIPVFIMIMGWGTQPERWGAGLYLIFYTLLGSFPLFFLILYMDFKSGSCYMFSSKCLLLKDNLLLLFLIMAFLVKFPMYGVHVWLLKAHVEAPVAGSMILAGILLKLGGYGLIRMLSVWGGSVNWVLDLVVVVSLWGGVLLSVSCLRQTDMKLLIAMSSVVHMSLCICSLMIISELGYKGCLMMMMGHGLCSSGLFFLANMVYERTGSRSMLVSKGLLNLMPSVSLWWFLLLVTNMSAPPGLNFASEVVLLISLISWEMKLMVGLMLMGFFSGAYSLYLFSLSQHGTYLFSNSGFSSGRLLEFLVLVLHWLPVNMMVLSAYLVS